MTGEPARLLVYRHDDPALAAVDNVGWVFDPTHEPDSVARAVLEFVNGLGMEFLLGFARRAVADDIANAEKHVQSLSRQVEIGQEWLAACHLTEAALMFTDSKQVTVGLALVPDWAGTPDELVMAVLAVTGPVG